MKIIEFTRTLFLSLLSLTAGVGAHRTFPQGITCGSQFSSPRSPLVIPNPEISWASYGIYTCDDPVMWYEADVEESQPIYFTLTVPELDRFRDVRMGVAFFGPGLPPLEEEDLSLPDALQTYAVESGLGVSIFISPYDQSSCSHLTSSAMLQSTTVKDERCHFYEPFGGSNMWVVMDEELMAPSKGTYKIAVFEQNGNTAKASFACCDWPEDFITPFDIPETTCAVCGSNPENPAWSSLFYEQKSMEAYGGYPPLQNCLADQTPIMLPEGDMCPPMQSSAKLPLQQPESCNLGCDSQGECHSHNVLGECTHILDWTLTPKFGDASVTNVIIFKGDKIRFTHDGEDGLIHNLFQIVNKKALDVCDFTGSSNLAKVEEVKIGHDITFNEAGVFHYTCSIGCNAPVGGMGQPEMIVNQAQDSNFCHCSIGQKLTVEVKDATDGLQCHSHAQSDPNHGMRVDEVATALECPQGTTNARAVNNPDFGAMDKKECAELCAPEDDIAFISGVEIGSCVALAYVYAAIMKTVQPPLSQVSIRENAALRGQVEVRITSNSPGQVDENCHCHSYEEIKCPGNETEDDTLYAEHIEEIEEYCQDILDGTETDCPYKCFQPMEVLHLHYLECPSRMIDQTYIAVNATNKCHIAAPAPPGTDTCPIVELPKSAGAPSDDYGTGDDFGMGFSFEFSIPAPFIAAIVVNAVLGFSILVALIVLSRKFGCCGCCGCCVSKPDDTASASILSDEDAENPKEGMS